MLYKYTYLISGIGPWLDWQIFWIICLTVIKILAIINWYSKIAVSNIFYVLTSILLTLTSTLTYFTLYQNSMVISSVLDCENVWTLTVDILNTICNRDCFADCSLDLTLIVSFWKVTFLVCRWKQIIISRSWNWTHLQFSTQCSNACQCVLCNFQWFRLTKHCSRDQLHPFHCHNNSKHVVHTYVPLSPGSVIWYLPKGGACSMYPTSTARLEATSRKT